MVFRLCLSIIAGILLAWVSSCALAVLVYFPCAYILFGGWPVILRLKHTLPRDIDWVRKGSEVIERSKKIRNQKLTFHKVWKRHVTEHPNKVAIHFEEEQWTFQRIALVANQVANYLSAASGVSVGESVALISENCPEFIVILLALSKLGCPAALINHNLSSKQWVHCITIAHCRAVIVACNLSGKLQQIEGDLVDRLELYCFSKGGEVGCDNDILIKSKSSPHTEPTNTNTDATTALCYTYTSGTTGLPKACPISHLYFLNGGYRFSMLAQCTTKDIVYIPLPLYHISALMLAFGMVVNNGCESLLVKKFSASRFWDDCATYNCTIVLYIGELCRYLLAQPNKLSDRKHKVTTAIGNGLRPCLWTEFKERFNLKNLIEFYGSTEGYGSFINVTQQPGFVGFQPISFREILFIAKLCNWNFFDRLKLLCNRNFLARINQETGELVRSPDGLCIRCEDNEPGECLGLVAEGLERMRNPYLSREDTTKKVVRNVMSRSDCYFRSGDVLSRNELGYVTFVDRRGDTFRWKGENVSTREVESIITSIVGHCDVIVYGVSIPGTEGKAGALGMVELDEEELDTFLVKLRSSLPSYSLPLFIRKIASPDLTSTFKYQKVRFEREGFDVSNISDPIFFLDPRYNKYVSLDTELFQMLMKGKIIL